MAEGNSLATVALLEDIVSSYDVSLSIHRELFEDTMLYVVLVIWRDTLSQHVTGHGESLYDALSTAYDKIQKKLEPKT
jgi:hypothetical protein